MSRRKLTSLRKLLYFLLTPLVKAWILFVWSSSRITILGEVYLLEQIKSGKPVIPCYWHQSLLMCSYYLIRQQKRGLRPGFLISPSVDGEVPANIVTSWGAKPIRGSSTRTGAQTIRDLYFIIKDLGISPANTPDGPSGPAFKVKPGIAMLAQTTGAPIIPIACISHKAWFFNSWDRFMLPKPFSRLVICIGEPVFLEKSRKFESLEQIQVQLENLLNSLQDKAKQHLSDTAASI